MQFTDLPAKAFTADTDGINNAIDALTSSREDASDLGQMLNEQPLEVIRRLLTLNRYQRAGLEEMTPDEIAELVRPVAEVLLSDDATRMRGFRLVEEITKQSPLRISCHLEVDW